MSILSQLFKALAIGSAIIAAKKAPQIEQNFFSARHESKFATCQNHKIKNNNGITLDGFYIIEKDYLLSKKFVAKQEIDNSFEMTLSNINWPFTLKKRQIIKQEEQSILYRTRCRPNTFSV